MDASGLKRMSCRGSMPTLNVSVRTRRVVGMMHPNIQLKITTSLSERCPSHPSSTSQYSKGSKRTWSMERL
jgi:hypothetical protein